jgi:hypothetical protein
MGATPWYRDSRIRPLLDDGELLELAVHTAHGPRVTPVVFETDGARLHCVAARGSAKVRAIGRDDRVAGLIRAGGRALMVSGRARIVDPLTLRAGGPERALRLPGIASGYLGRNVRHAGALARGRPVPTLPLSRVMLELDVARGAVLDSERVLSRFGRWEPLQLLITESVAGMQAPKLEGLPPRVARLLGDESEIALGWPTLSGPIALPGRWRDGHVEVVGRATELAGAQMSGPACVTFSRTGPRLRDKYGLMLTGQGSASRAGALTAVRLDCKRATWWEGDDLDSARVVR